MKKLMLNMLEGIYHNGTIEIKNQCKINENTHLKILIFEVEKNRKPIKKNKTIFGTYKFGNLLDSVDLRDFAYED